MTVQPEGNGSARKEEGRVLMFYPSLLFPPDRGSRRRGLFVLDYLVSRFKSIDLCLVHVSPEEDATNAEELGRRGARVHFIHSSEGTGPAVWGRLHRWASLLFKGRMPSYESPAFLDPVLAAEFRQVVREVRPDLVLITHTQFAGLAGAWTGEVFSVIDTIDVFKDLHQCYADYSGMKAMVAPLLLGYREHGSAFGSEVEILRRYQRIIAISRGDYDAFLQAGLSSDAVFEIGESCGEPRPEPVAAAAGKDTDLLFVASRFLGTEESARFLLQQVLPRCRRVSSLTVVGPICGFIESQALRPPETVRMHLAGIVPDLATFYDRSRLVVIPVLRGTGVSIKCAEAFSHGAAVVTTRMGARGVAAIDGKNCLMADDPDDFAQKVDAALEDPSLRVRLGESALAGSRRSRVEAYESLDRLCAPVLG